MLGIGVPEIFILLIIWGIPGAIGAWLAISKGRNAFGWFLACAMFWLPILIIILLPPMKEVPGKYRECPSCREFVKWHVILCKHCQTALAPNGDVRG